MFIFLWKCMNIFLLTVVFDKIFPEKSNLLFLFKCFRIFLRVCLCFSYDYMIILDDLFEFFDWILVFICHVIKYLHFSCILFHVFSLVFRNLGKFLVEVPLAHGGSQIGWRYHYRHPIWLPLGLWGESNRMTVMIPSSYLTPPIVWGGVK